jgi:membrane associated rhomboid family serine protease
MILPIGHQEREVRRLPWVTFALMAICALVFLFTDTSMPEGVSKEERAAEAADYWRQRAYLDADEKIRDLVAYDVAPAQRSQYLATLPDLSPYGRDADGGLAAQQAELDRLTDLALGVTADANAQTAFERFGLVPAHLSVRSFVTHMFLHAGWFHLLGNLFLLLLAGPPIEDRLGRAMYAAFYGASGVFAALLYAALASDPQIPMVGASGAIAGVLGAFAVRLWSTQIRFAYFFMFGFRPTWGTFEAPAWAMLSLWFANELFQAWFWDAVGIAGGVANWAHVGGFAFGAGAAYALRALRFEERFIDPALDAQMTRFSANPVLEEAMAARERGDVAGAIALLRDEWERAPDDGIALALWDAALASGEAASAAPALLGVVRAAAQRGEHDLALRHWSELSDHVPGALAEPVLLLRLVPLLVAENQRERAALALRQASDPANTALTPGQALRVFELARDLDAIAATRAARRALESPDLHEAKRAKIAGWVAEHGASDGLRPASARCAQLAEPPPVPAAEQPTAEDPAPLAPVFGEDGAIELARFARAKLVEARPVRLDDEGLHLALEGDRAARVSWSRIQAVSVAIVANLAPKPILLIDLLANWNASEAEALQGVRLRSDRYDPRALLGVEGDARRAFATLAGRLIQVTRGQPLPSAEQALGNPFARFDSLEDYERIVLEVAE